MTNPKQTLRFKALCPRCKAENPDIADNDKFTEHWSARCRNCGEVLRKKDVPEVGPNSPYPFPTEKIDGMKWEDSWDEKDFDEFFEWLLNQKPRFREDFSTWFNRMVRGVPGKTDE